MKEFKEFYIPFSSLTLGSNFFHHKIGKTFFESFNYSSAHDCDIDVNIEFRKEVHLMDIRINYKGKTNVQCDRCLGNIEVAVNSNFNSIIKFGHVDDEVIKEGVIYLPYEAHQFNVAPIIYEHYLLNFPKRNVHAEGKCDAKQLEIVMNYINNSHQNHDPRWNALKELKDKKN
jgi:uncharacterized metal-binding protein YceD (DUF177 family)